MVSASPAKNRPPIPQRLTPDSRLTDRQAAFAQLIAQGLNSASNAYRLAYKRSTTGEWWCRQQAYNLLQKPHVQALIAKLKAQYDSVKPALTRVSKREILHGMAIDENLDPMDRQRAVDIDNKMQGEYQERVHLTGDVIPSMFRANAGAIPWQLAESLSDVKPSPTEQSKVIDGCVTTVQADSPDGGTGTPAIQPQLTAGQDADSSHSLPLPSASESSPDIHSPAQSKPAKRKPARKLNALQRAALRSPRTKH